MSDTPILDTEPYKGVRDFYPADWSRLATVFDRARTLLTSYGYEEYQASPLEHSELYESKGNEEIIREQTFSFEDRGGRRVTLRPEMTPTLARMVANKRRELVFPLRWFSIGNRFRYERPQRGRLREFYQTDIDLVGLPEGEADAEIVTLAYKLLKSFGATDADFTIRLNSRKLLRLSCEAAGIPEGEASKKYWQLIDRKEKMSREEFEAARKEFPGDPLSIIEAGEVSAVAEEKARLEAFVETLNARGISNAAVDFDIVRGFEYYTGMVFEINDTDKANPRALFGGGRYDGLVSMFGGEPIPAVGFAFGDVTLLDFLETHNLLPEITNMPELYIGTPEAAMIPEAQKFADMLRTDGLRVFVNMTEKSLGDQIKDAVRRGIPYFAAYGSDELQGSELRIKHLETGEERTVAKSEVVASVRS